MQITDMSFQCIMVEHLVLLVLMILYMEVISTQHSKKIGKIKMHNLKEVTYNASTVV